jgi:hypothetical protein
MKPNRKRKLLVWLAIASGTLTAIGFLSWMRAGMLARRCCNNMLQLWGGAGSYCIENNIGSSVTLEKPVLSAYLKGWDCCPSSGLEYAPFSCDNGPVCPVDAMHTLEFRKWMCALNLVSLWEDAVRLAGQRNLGWQDVVKPDDVYGRYNPIDNKRTARCPLTPVPYSSFVLAEGPKCPIESAHTQHRDVMTRSSWLFTSSGVLKSNLSPRELAKDRGHVPANNDRDKKAAAVTETNNCRHRPLQSPRSSESTRRPSQNE